ncbi:MAG: low molecular weight phosphotyrosine protein phosphatase, partial [Clostridia bacterium]|nr:low molecular weight phosphotyrosine protein phosphatase [Clostridia bacterium]
MIKVLFVCLGNICRSPMAEFVMRYKLDKMGVSDKIYVSSAGTSSEEEGNAVHRGTARILDRLGIDYSVKRARRISMSDKDNYDYIVAMDSSNIRALSRIGISAKKLLDYTGSGRDVADPWYTGDFYNTYEYINAGVDAWICLLYK